MKKIDRARGYDALPSITYGAMRVHAHARNSRAKYDDHLYHKWTSMTSGPFNLAPSFHMLLVYVLMSCYDSFGLHTCV
jgi:hypothetical protein